MGIIQVGQSPSLGIVGDGSSTFTVTSGNAVVLTANATGVTTNVTVAVNTLSAGNINNSSSTNGFSFNLITGRNQISAYGFTFNQDGDVLTPTNKTRYTFTYTGADQTFVVPAGVTYIYAKLWGAGGGAARAGGWTYGADGGGGGHTRGIIPVTPGITIYVKVGSGGYTSNSNNTVYGGGGTGGGTGDNQFSGMGGGYCGIFNTSVTFANTLAIAGGGGGGGSSNTNWDNLGPGGAGGGAQAQRGQATSSSATGGGGATQNSGGTGGTGNSFSSNPGTQLTGGNAGTNNYGGGGGGGYYGGGGGGYTNGNLMGGGGGGSGYVIGTAILAQTYTGNYRNPAFYWDPDLMAGYTGASIAEMPGYGAVNTRNINSIATLVGGHAVCVIYY
jgi:Glycine rich protein